MLEPPSAELSNTLQTLGLCTPRDLRRVRPLVRRLRHDLPPFDSLWLDALVRTRVLTPFQARCLESGDGDRLRVGPYVVIDRLTNRADQASYLVRDPAGAGRLVLKQLTLPADSAAAFAQRLAPYLQVAARLRSPALVLPADLHRDSTSPAVLSPFVPGKPLHELLVRRGRFPAAVVATIAAQLLEGLAELAEHQLLHGDIRLAHVRIRPTGRRYCSRPGSSGPAPPSSRFTST